MQRHHLAVFAAAGLLGFFQLIPGATTAAHAGGVGYGGIGHMSPVTVGAPAGTVTPFGEPRYNLGAGNTAPEAGVDSCLQTCMTGATGTGRHTRHSCRKSCASTAF
jgi:hypothetical protein